MNFHHLVPTNLSNFLFAHVFSPFRDFFHDDGCGVCGNGDEAAEACTGREWLEAGRSIVGAGGIGGEVNDEILKAGGSKGGGSTLYGYYVLETMALARGVRGGGP